MNTSKRCAMISVSLSLLLSACGKKSSSEDKPIDPVPQTPAPSIDPTTKLPNPGTIVDEAGFFVAVVGDTKDFFSIHKGQATFSEPCKINLGESVDCYIEGEEHNLYDKDIVFQYHVPRTMCSYVQIEPFYFVNRRTKLQTSQLVTYTDRNGSFGSTINGSNNVTSSDFGCYMTGITPTCCVGEYVQVDNKWDTATNAFTSSAITVKRTMEACLGGPGTITQPKNWWGMPVPTYKFVAGEGASEKYTLERGAAKLQGSGWKANFFDPADHSGTTPTAMRFDINSANPSSPFVVGQPYYTINCRDAGYEVLAQARIIVREWNTVSAYANRQAAPGGHDDVGVESNPFSFDDKNDHVDWKDIGSSFPGYTLPAASTTTPTP